MSEFGIDRARALATHSHETARAALSEVARSPSFAGGHGPDGRHATAELEDITDFIFTRTS